jgi:arginyl-tRNA synthetase
MLTVVKEKIAEACKDYWERPADEILPLFETPKELSHGHLSLPVFQLARVKRKAPPLIAKELTEKLLSMELEELDKIEAVNGFVNIHCKTEFLLELLFGHVKNEGQQLGFSKRFKGKKVIIDYSSPNVAKPMHIGHLRATVIGQAIRNLAQTQGYEVTGVNHLGDWGSQFGKLCFAYEKWGSEFDFKNDPFESLYKLYVKFHDEAEKNPELESEGAAYFKRLEDGDTDLLALWKKFIDILVRGESFYNDRMEPVIHELESKNLLVEDQGAMVVMMDEDGVPPCLIKKTDGATLYATRDLATADYRMNELGADLNLYVVGQDQTLHFKQVFKVLEKLGRPWVTACHHISFGLVRFKDMGKISSRKGNIIRFSDVLNKATELVGKIVREKNPDLENVEDVIEKVAVGAITFNDLVNDRVKDVEFDWERALSFDGDSGPYVQYVYVRCASLLRKYGKEADLVMEKSLESEEERALLRILLDYPNVLKGAFDHFKPNILANYLLDVCAAYNRFYHNHKILSGDPELVSTRMALVRSVKEVISQGLGHLNIKVPEHM